ncbi:MAG TPA: cation-transporting P-type ATPase, partial [Acidimicrobiia bacterium]|nr:cation-transporting P-type ATPase [Acidimicrobiia bacterium]
MQVEVALLSVDDALARLETRREGLSMEEASVRLGRVGPNVLPSTRGPGLARQLVAQLTHFFALMLWVAAALAFVGDLPELGVAIIVVVIVNGAFSFIQEYRAERAVHALTLLLPDTAVVRRGGRKLSIAAADLVPGDIVLLREGDRISADARVVASSELKVDMSALTGESEPIPRMTSRHHGELGDALDSSNVVFAGTFVTSGSGTAVVTDTGAATRLGNITELTAGVVRRPTPLRVEMNRVVR